jgi:beta-lactamase superfamily II metal-dependent hydrolase
MSDSGEKTENSLLAYGLNLRSDIIIKGQQFRPVWLGSIPDAVQPQLIIATSRDFPEYERIRDEWAERVRARGIKLFRQDETGAVTVRVGRDGWEAQSYLTGEAFRSSSR